MSGGYRDDRPALVVLALLVGSIVLISILGLWSRQTLDQPIGEPEAAATEGYQGQRGPSEGYWWPEFSTRDTYAQWAMSVLALVATATGILGVIWIRQTLQATRETARAAVDATTAAREIGEAQVRAYLGVSKISASIEGSLLDAKIVVEVHVGNGGQTPARNLTFRGYIFYVGEDTEVRALHIDNTADPADIYSGEVRRVFSCRVEMTAFEIADLEHRRGGIKLAGAIWYTPVASQKRHYLRYAYALFPENTLTQNRQLRPLRGERGNSAN